MSASIFPEWSQYKCCAGVTATGVATGLEMEFGSSNIDNALRFSGSEDFHFPEFCSQTFLSLPIRKDLGSPDFCSPEDFCSPDFCSPVELFNFTYLIAKMRKRSFDNVYLTIE